MFKKSVLALIAIFSFNLAIAGDGFDHAAINPKSSNKYMVSAILKKNGTDSTIKLVQTIELATSKDEAVGILFKHIRKEFDGYSVLDSVVMPVPTDNSNCGYRV
jgi:hypothetical protein